MTIMQITASSAIRISLTPDPTKSDRMIVGDRGAKPRWREAAAPTYSGGTILQRFQKTWSHLSATVDHVESEESLDIQIETTVPRISVVLEEVGGRLITRKSIASVSEVTSDARAGTISILPAGFRAHGHASQMRLLRHLVIDLDEAELESVSEDNGGTAGQLTPRLMFADPDLANICALIANECSASERSGTLYADSLSWALMVALARIKKSDTPETARGGLSPSQLRRAQGYMLENVSEGVSLKQLAALTKISLAHFCRAFKASTGKAPHQWLIEARIEQAKSYLLEKKDSIADIAVMLGFCDQAHFTRTFNKIVGTTPLVWQRR
jgi:AraC-like DNA-binding protein